MDEKKIKNVKKVKADIVVDGDDVERALAAKRERESENEEKAG